VGKDAQSKYYSNYKNLSKLLSLKKLNAINTILPALQHDPSTLVLEEIQNLGVLPCCMGLVKNRGEESVLNVKGQKFGDKYLKAVAAGLRECKLVESCEFSSNRITTRGFD
jgi:hypothetical protein